MERNPALGYHAYLIKAVRLFIFQTVHLITNDVFLFIEHYAEAVGDFSECLRLQDPILDADDRLRAETYPFPGFFSIDGRFFSSRLPTL